MCHQFGTHKHHPVELLSQEVASEKEKLNQSILKLRLQYEQAIQARDKLSNVIATSGASEAELIRTRFALLRENLLKRETELLESLDKIVKSSTSKLQAQSLHLDNYIFSCGNLIGAAEELLAVNSPEAFLSGRPPEIEFNLPLNVVKPSHLFIILLFNAFVQFTDVYYRVDLEVEELLQTISGWRLIVCFFTVAVFIVCYNLSITYFIMLKFLSGYGLFFVQFMSAC
jgi:hypothetical protein